MPWTGQDEVVAKIHFGHIYPRELSEIFQCFLLQKQLPAFSPLNLHLITAGDGAVEASSTGKTSLRTFRRAGELYITLENDSTYQARLHEKVDCAQQGRGLGFWSCRLSGECQGHPWG